MNANDSAFPKDYDNTPGLSKREYVAIALASGMLSNSEVSTGVNRLDLSPEDEAKVRARAAVLLADALIKELGEAK